MMRRQRLTSMFLCIVAATFGQMLQADGVPLCGATDPVLHSQGNWRQKAAIAECLRQNRRYSAAQDYFLAASEVIYNLDDTRFSADEKSDLGLYYYHSALNDIALRQPNENIATELYLSLMYRDDDRAAALLKKVSGLQYGHYLEKKRKDQAIEDQKQADLAQDAAANPIEREQFQWWDSLSPDQRDVVKMEGGTRRQNMNARPCRTTTADSRGIHIVNWHYCDPNAPSHETLYEFVNGKLEQTIRV
jgi:tetratricopeptide (TPR) repeat protein